MEKLPGLDGVREKHLASVRAGLARLRCPASAVLARALRAGEPGSPKRQTLGQSAALAASRGEGHVG